MVESKVMLINIKLHIRKICLIKQVESISLVENKAQIS